MHGMARRRGDGRGSTQRQAIGLFTALFLLFLRFLPCINIAEVKWAKKESDVLYDDKQQHPDEGTVVEAAYQQEVEKGTAEI